MGDVRKDPRAWKIVQDALPKYFHKDEKEEKSAAESEAFTEEMNAASMEFTPLRAPVSFGGEVSMADIQAIVDKLNALEN